MAIQKYVGVHVRHLGSIDPEDARDISSEKTLDLLSRLERHEWEPMKYTPAQLCAFIATVARNGVVDQLNLRRRETQAWWDEPVAPADAARNVEADETAGAIVECFERMTPRARLVWLLRVFYELSAEETAAHPDLDTTPAAIDMMLARCRKHMRRCARAKGLDPASLPVGTLTSLWEMVMERER
jgi:RNA polymerase sigma factor (sigma-70 family)